MRRLLLTLLALLSASIQYGQVLQTRYYNDRYLQKEVSENKAKFVQTATRNLDGSVTTEVKNIRSNDVIGSETFKGDEPAGIWKYSVGNSLRDLDYSFVLFYSDRSCSDTIVGLKNYWEDNESLKYKAPGISEGGLTIMQFINSNIIYPDAAREAGLQGRVMLTVTIGSDGRINDIVVRKGVNKSLDKEAVRVIRALKLSSPAMVDGKPIAICFSLPLAFRLE